MLDEEGNGGNAYYEDDEAFEYMVEKLVEELKLDPVKAVKLASLIDDYMDYYNSERYQYELSKLSPNEYLKYYKTGIYPLKDLVDEDEKTIKKFDTVKANLKRLEEEKLQAAASIK